MNDLENKVCEKQVEIPKMTGYLDWSGITESNLVEVEEENESERKDDDLPF